MAEEENAVTDDAGTTLRQEDQAPPAEGKPAEGAPTEGKPAEGADTDTRVDAEGEQPKGGDDIESETLLSGDEGSGSDGEGEEGEGDAETRAPETYEFKPPEGVEISEEAQSRIDKFAEDVARKLDLTQEQFQGLMENIVERRQQQGNQLADKYLSRIENWADTVRNDNELGGENLDANVAVAKTALKQFGSKELGKLIDKPGPENPDGLGLGNNPEFLRLMYRVGKAIGEGNLITSQSDASGAPSETDRLRRYYPTMFPEQKS